MEVSNIIKEIDAQIAKLQQARALLADAEAAPKQRGRPKGSKNVPAPAVEKSTVKRTLSPERRKRIADAMKKRWAARRKAKA